MDLAPYRMRPGEVLIGARGYWMNHGFGDTTLTLLRAEGKTLRPVLAVPVESETPEVEEKGVVAMAARPAAARRDSCCDSDQGYSHAHVRGSDQKWSTNGLAAQPRRRARLAKP